MCDLELFSKIRSHIYYSCGLNKKYVILVFILAPWTLCTVVPITDIGNLSILGSDIPANLIIDIILHRIKEFSVIVNNSICMKL